MNINRLILGDNQEIVKSMVSETIDLIYLDPPFFSNRNYEIIWGADGKDTYQFEKTALKSWRTTVWKILRSFGLKVMDR